MAEHELYGVLERVAEEQEESFCGIELDDYPEKYHNLILSWLNGELTPDQAVAIASKQSGRE